MDLKKIKGIVLGMLGKETFTFSKEGSIEFTDKESADIAEAFGQEFVDKFKSAIGKENAGEAEGNELFASIVAHNNNKVRAEVEKAVDGKLELLSQKMGELEGKLVVKETELDAKISENKELKSKIEQLADLPEDEIETEEETIEKEKVMKDFKANRNYFHNKMAFEFFEGNSSKAIISRSNGFVVTDKDSGVKMEGIDASEIKSEFGTYISQTGFETLTMLTQEIESTKYMTTKMAITEWRASKANMGSVVQQFISKWTPLGEADFTPITVKNYRHKVNLPITPDDINDSWLSFLYDERMTPDQMPITKYIIEKLLVPKVDDDRELLLLGHGVYVALNPGTVQTGDPGQATGGSMDGFLTIIAQQKALGGTSKVNFYTPATDFNDAGANAVTWMEDFAKWVKGLNRLYASKGMNIFCAPENAEKYWYKYRDMFPTTKNEDGQKTNIDFTKFNIVPLPSMIGSDTIFATPKENFIHLKNLNTGASNIFMQVADYDVKVFAEWWEGVGFAIAELLFAYCPDSGSGSGSGS